MQAARVTEAVAREAMRGCTETRRFGEETDGNRESALSK
jgi:hypothetical protein